MIYARNIIFGDSLQSPDMEIAFPGWNDTDSGLRGFTYKVYRLIYTVDKKLQNLSVPVLSKGYDLFTEEFTSKFRLPDPGMYAVVAGIHDFANNTRYTRGLILYTDPNNTIEKTDIPLAVYPGPGNMTVDGAFWLSDLNQPVKLKWGKHFANKFLAENHYGSPVARIPRDFLESKGNVSSSEVKNIDGIIKFSFSIIHRLQLQKSRRRRQITLPETWTAVNPLEDEITLPALTPRADGNSYTIYMKVEDLAGNVFTDYTYIRVDSTAPKVNDISPNFRKNATKAEKGFYSRFYSHVHCISRLKATYFLFSRSRNSYYFSPLSVLIYLPMTLMVVFIFLGSLYTTILIQTIQNRSSPEPRSLTKVFR